MNQRSDVQAKVAFCHELEGRGYKDARVASFPADISASLHGERYYFEIKFTRALKRYFGAATLTEWLAAAENPERFRFVIAYEIEGVWEFDEYTPEEFMEYSYVPPFKIFFNVPLEKKATEHKKRASRRVHLTPERLMRMQELFQTFRPPPAETTHAADSIAVDTESI